ncbi:hypothetical protein B0T20DRAFT_180239 [Sordaria brevicollis]|uniref:Uncharacterized protein n=1 Tax=Sordaria brevicollis TaxID=83679 RepID=A0AAE0UDX1_SORBR|nr:hypothetical protein B0T20DRAFT_180239 [Sordaria brevicollis]
MSAQKNKVEETANMLTQSSSLFFTMLPSEIRDAIYRHALTIWPHQDTIGYYRFARKRPRLALLEGGVKGPLPGILFVCKRMYHELPRDLLTGFSICVTKRPASDPAVIGALCLSTAVPEESEVQLFGIGAYGDMPLEKRHVLTIFIDGDPFVSTSSFLFHGAIGLFTSLMLPMTRERAEWRLCHSKPESRDIDRVGNSVLPPGRAKEVATGVKTLILERIPGRAARKEKKPESCKLGGYLDFFKFVDTHSPKWGVKWSLERVVFKGGFERSWVEKLKKVLAVNVVCEEYLTPVDDEMA